MKVEDEEDGDDDDDDDDEQGAEDEESEEESEDPVPRKKIPPNRPKAVAKGKVGAKKKNPASKKK